MLFFSKKKRHIVTTYYYFYYICDRIKLISTFSLLIKGGNSYGKTSEKRS